MKNILFEINSLKWINFRLLKKWIFERDRLKAYITILGRSQWAVVNSYYAVLEIKDYRPDIVYIITEKPYKKYLEDIKKGITIISKEFGFNPKIELIEVGEADFIGTYRNMKEILNYLMELKSKIAIDITSARKALVSGALLSIPKLEAIDHLFYLAIQTIKDVDKPYCIIPKKIQKLMDFAYQIKEESIN